MRKHLENEEFTKIDVNQSNKRKYWADKKINKRSVRGMAFSIDISRNETKSIELENNKNGKIKNRLLDNIIRDITSKYPDIWSFKRTNGVIFFYEFNAITNISHTVETIFKRSKYIIDSFNNHFETELFKGSYGAELTGSNLFIKFNGKDEIIGTAINISYKIAAHDENLQSLFIGKNLSEILSVEKKSTFNVVKGIVYPAYKYKSILSTNVLINDVLLQLNTKYENLVLNDNGAIYLMFDIIGSTKALLNFDIYEIAINHLNTLEVAYSKMTALGFKSEFRGDGILFWKHGVSTEIFQKTLSTINNIENSENIKKYMSVDNLKNRNINMEIFANRSLKIRMGIDASEKYHYTNSEEPSISKHKVIAEIAEKYATRKDKIVSGESFLSKLYMNHNDYGALVKEIGGYKLRIINNKYLKDSVKRYEKRWVSRIFKKEKIIDFNIYRNENSKAYVKNFGKEARENNSVERREGMPTEDTEYNGLHFYGIESGPIMQVFINDGKGSYIEY